MKAGVSTACLYPRLLEESLYDLAVNGITNVEIFINTDCELQKSFISSMAATLNRFEVTCKSLHPYTCSIEPMMFFSVYERRVSDALEYYKKYFNAMNLLGADIFVFHGNKNGLQTPNELYFERFSQLVRTGREFGITVAQENVSRCQSGSLIFQKEMLKTLGNEANFVIDTKQCVRANENPFDTVRALGSSIVHIHMSDHGELGDCLQIGKGRFNIKKFLTLIKEVGFDGSIMLELYRSNFSTISDLVNNFNTLESMIDSIESL